MKISKYILKKKIFLAFAGLFCSFFFVSNFANASTLTLPLSVTSSIGANIPVTPITYNGTTYSDYIWSISNAYTEGTYSLSLIFYNPTDETVSYATTNELNQVYGNIFGDDILNCTVSGTLPLSVATCTVNPASTDVVVLVNPYTGYSVVSSGYSRDIYSDETGLTILYIGGADFFPFPTQFDYLNPVGNSWLNDSFWWVIDPLDYQKENIHSAINFSAVSGDNPVIKFGLNKGCDSIDDCMALSPYKISLYAGNTELETWSPTYSTHSISPLGFLRYDALPSPGMANITTYLPQYTGTDQNYHIYYLINDITISNPPEWIDTYSDVEFNIKGSIMPDNIDQINAVCDNIPHEFSLGLVPWTFDLHTDDLCKWVVPPDNYFPTKIMGLFTTLGNKFAFVGQLYTAINGFISAVVSTPVSPSATFGGMYGSGGETVDFSALTPLVAIVRSWLNVILYIIFLRWLLLSFIWGLFAPESEIIENLDN